MNNFQVIKSHLEYGHKEVEVSVEDSECKGFTETLIAVHPDSTLTAFINKYGVIVPGYRFDHWHKMCITPIPHRYKKLEVGTKVDVLDLEEIKEHLEDWAYNIIGKRNCTLLSSNADSANIVYSGKDESIATFVPLWAITPHVEGEKKGLNFRASISTVTRETPWTQIASDVSVEIGKERTIELCGKTYKVLITEEK